MNTKLAAIVACSLLAIAAPTLARGGGHGHSSLGRTRSSPGEHLVSGYTNKNGTFVAPHYQTNSDNTRNDNYSTRGNFNPHTGEAGTKPRDEDITPR